MKKKILLLFITQIITSFVFAQNYEVFESDDVEGYSKKSIVYKEFENKYEFTISKHNLSRNNKNDIFEILAFNKGIVEKIILKQNKKSKRISVKKLKVSKKEKHNFQNFINNLNRNDFFELKNEKINCMVENKDKSLSIAPFDNNLYYFEIFMKDKYKLLYSDCVENHPNFLKKPNEKETLKYWECINIFKNYWD